MLIIVIKLIYKKWNKIVKKAVIGARSPRPIKFNKNSGKAHLELSSKPHTNKPKPRLLSNELIKSIETFI